MDEIFYGFKYWHQMMTQKNYCVIFILNLQWFRRLVSRPIGTRPSCRPPPTLLLWPMTSALPRPSGSPGFQLSLCRLWRFDFLWAGGHKRRGDKKKFLWSYIFSKFIFTSAPFKINLHEFNSDSFVILYYPCIYVWKVLCPNAPYG